jgi:hypothetical protein
MNFTRHIDGPHFSCVVFLSIHCGYHLLQHLFFIQIKDSVRRSPLCVASGNHAMEADTSGKTGNSRGWWIITRPLYLWNTGTKHHKYPQIKI